MEDSKSSELLEKFYINSGFSTRCLHAGEHVGQPQHATHAGAIYQTSTFVFENVDEGADIFAGRKSGYAYTRFGNPTVKVLEAKINALEGGDLKKKNPDIRVSTQAFSSGMAAISASLMAAASHGDTIIMGDVLYSATEHLALNVLNRFGIKTVQVNTCDLNAVEDCLKKNPNATAFFLETPTNPLLAVSDIAGVSKLIKKTNPKMRLIVDNTFATPYLQRPLEMGADVVVHSTTKYICGHGTVVGGLVTTIDDQFKDALFVVLKDVGANPSPFDTWLVNMGLKTLPIRMEQHCANAMAVARYLEQHPKVEKVYYPGLESSPFYQLARKQMKLPGGMMSIELKGGLEAGRKMMNDIKLFSLAVSLGSVDSLIQHPATMTHASVPREKRLASGLSDGLVRISVGIEDCNDLIAALENSLKRA